MDLLSKIWIEAQESNKNPVELLHIRKDLVKEFSWAVPTTKTIQKLVELGPIVEMGAGTGYWASQVKIAGGDIIAYDQNPPANGLGGEGFGINLWQSNNEHGVVFKGTPIDLKNHSDRALFLCWPPLNSLMAKKCLSYWKGDTLIYVGNEINCADKHFYSTLTDNFQLIETHSLPDWIGGDDWMTIWKLI